MLGKKRIGLAHVHSCSSHHFNRTLAAIIKQTFSRAPDRVMWYGAEVTNQRTPELDAKKALDLIEELIQRCPRHIAGSDDERLALEIVAGEFEELGLEPQWHDFKTNESLYALLALHFGIGVAGSLVASRAPLLAFALHTLAGSSYLLDSTKRAFLLRRLLPQKISHNILMTLPAKDDTLRLRIVLLGHIDAAFTGHLFSPKTVQNAANSPKWLRPLTSRPLATATWSQFALAALDLLRVGPLAGSPLVRLAYWGLTIPGLAALALNLEIVLRDEAVPGANDNLTAVAALLLLAERFLASKPDDVEIVLAVTGSEEAGLSGSEALARDREDEWDPRCTVVLAPDGICHGELRWFVEGEIFKNSTAPWLENTLRDLAASDPHFDTFRPFYIPAGATDALSFKTRGYDALGFGCVDPQIGAPRHYHQPTDTAANLDGDELLRNIDFTEALVLAVATHHPTAAGGDVAT